MNEQFQSIWRKERKGPRAFLLWALIVSLAAFLFAAALTTILYFFAPALLLACSDGYGYSVWQIPGLVPVLIGLRVMALFMGVVGTVFAFRYIVRRFFSSSSQPSMGQKAPAAAQPPRDTDYISAK
jgi:hypothetical protein